MDDKDLALQRVNLITVPGEKYDASFRRFQGVPSIERSRGGRLWAAWYGGGIGEGSENYVLLMTSDDDGYNWSPPRLVIDPPGKVRASDPCLWLDPLNRIWLFWAQNYGFYDGRCGVWASICSNPDEESLQWSQPRRLSHGIMLNKPTVLSTGEWLFPTALWTKVSSLNDLPNERYSNVLVSEDRGETFFKRGLADVPNRNFDEHMIVERRDGSLWMLVRTTYGIGESTSYDRGKTWSPGKPTRLGGPNSRFFIRRLRSGRLLLVNHYGFNGRSHLTAQLSDDDGLTWNEGLLLDGRTDVSYPDGTESPNGTLYIIYDRERTKNMEILLAVIREEDILAGCCISPSNRLQALVNRAGFKGNGNHYQDPQQLLKYRNFLSGSRSSYSGEKTDDEGKKTVYLAIQYMDDHLLHIREMKEISDALGYSLSHLSRLFSNELGIAMQYFYTNRKWQKAMDLLEEGACSITKIASIMQYESIHTFSRAFKNATGLSPSHYIRQYKETCRANIMLYHSRK